MVAHQVLKSVGCKTEGCHISVIDAITARIPGDFCPQNIVNPLFRYFQLGFAPGTFNLIAQLVERLKLALRSSVRPREAPCGNDNISDPSSNEP
jgi:hypothetical protein